MANRRYTSQFLYQFEAYPVLLNCNFIVDSANGNGLGQRSLKGEGFHNVYMNTTATPLSGNPNPAPGLILVQFTDVYSRAISASNSIISPLGASSSATTARAAETITSLGTATLAQWRAVGLPQGVTPSVGISFVATTTATIGGGATIAPTASSGISHLEGVGDASQDAASMMYKTPTTGTTPNAIGSTTGGFQLIQCLNSSNALTAPTDGTVISLQFLLSNSSTTVKGQ